MSESETGYSPRPVVSNPDNRLCAVVVPREVLHHNVPYEPMTIQLVDYGEWTAGGEPGKATGYRLHFKPCNPVVA